LFTEGIGRPSAIDALLCTMRDTKRSLALYAVTLEVIVCMTARLDKTPKATEQNRIVHTGKSEAEVTCNKKTALEVLYY